MLRKEVSLHSQKSNSWSTYTWILQVIALQIMKTNYEQLVKAHKAQSLDSEKAFVPAEIKFQVSVTCCTCTRPEWNKSNFQTFQLLMDKLFDSFNEQVGMNNFSELSGCVFSWLEDRCKPQVRLDNERTSSHFGSSLVLFQMLQELMCDVLNEVRGTYQALEQHQQQQAHNHQAQQQAQQQQPPQQPSLHDLRRSMQLGSSRRESS